ncbi:hypothetical protein [Roseomonas chloroacetimidivorans]|jgi:hypothetical protein|uniref:hypothetical protein n=1 Tax=Roseomonas chloroacetimidivorans TaxID=1766656 RepID=UPI003C73BD8C
MPKGNADTDRSAGGPGSSHQGGNHGHAHREKGGHTVPGAPTNAAKSQVSGGGGERDSHHTHDPKMKGERTGY